MTVAEVPPSRRARRRAAAGARADARHRRLAGGRYAVPYDLEGPKVTLGVAWFAAVVGAALLHPAVLAALVAVVAGLAAAQTTDAWRAVPSPRSGPAAAPTATLDRRLAAAAAAALPAAALAGTAALGVAVLATTVLGALAALALAGGDRVAALHGAVVNVRSVVPAGLAGGSLVALEGRGTPALISLVAVISAYELGDFLIGSASDNAVEGPVAGGLSAAFVGAAVAVVQPEDLGRPVWVPLVAAVALAPAGQLAASAVLPLGVAWAPALRRLDSYLIAAPLWLLLV